MSFRPIQHLAADPALRAALRAIPREAPARPKAGPKRRNGPPPPGFLTLAQVAARLGYACRRSAGQWCKRHAIDIHRDPTTQDHRQIVKASELETAITANLGAR